MEAMSQVRQSAAFVEVYHRWPLPAPTLTTTGQEATIAATSHEATIATTSQESTKRQRKAVQHQRYEAWIQEMVREHRQHVVVDGHWNLKCRHCERCVPNTWEAHEEVFTLTLKDAF